MKQISREGPPYSKCPCCLNERSLELLEDNQEPHIYVCSVCAWETGRCAFCLPDDAFEEKRKEFDHHRNLPEYYTFCREYPIKTAPCGEPVRGSHPYCLKHLDGRVRTPGRRILRMTCEYP